MQTATVREGREPLGERTRWAIRDGLVLTRRNLLRYIRIPTLLVFSTIQPVMFVLLFRYVFGGAITNLPGGINYVNYLMPGIFVQTAIFGSTQTGIGLAEDLNAGIIDRFRSLPMSRSAVLAGRTTADLFRNLFVV
ncbi:MAG: ABC transporter permease, partial [Actinomycetota bacterium]